MLAFTLGTFAHSAVYPFIFDGAFSIFTIPYSISRLIIL